uniref:Uncharacterized protein n=1 Tax=Coccidioides posadasii RMSCC 3488 TaxID=454284 RepID=A0A0J6FGB0_COCPO|nr:hypothetical protein CPAG_05641 [Coccidioides posadasii RMSCC 3488]
MGAEIRCVNNRVISWGRVKAKVLLDTVKSHGGVVTPISPAGHARLWTYHTHLLTRYLESAQKFSWDQIQAHPYCTHSLALNRRWALSELSMGAYGCCSYRSCALSGNYLNYAYSNITTRKEIVYKAEAQHSVCRSEKDCQHLIKGHRYQIPAFQTRGLQGEAQASHAEARERR